MEDFVHKPWNPPDWAPCKAPTCMFLSLNPVVWAPCKAPSFASSYMYDSRPSRLGAMQGAQRFAHFAYELYAKTTNALNILLYESSKPADALSGLLILPKSLKQKPRMLLAFCLMRARNQQMPLAVCLFCFGAGSKNHECSYCFA